jgi:hypothetical protein
MLAAPDPGRFDLETENELAEGWRRAERFPVSSADSRAARRAGLRDGDGTAVSLRG